ncbi:hypothetical protein EK904_004847 [Melospiza melodia maxima]|nr:hypothetical protein EK904_004847 [Melospiza melodia maxima]
MTCRGGFCYPSPQEEVQRKDWDSLWGAYSKQTIANLSQTAELGSELKSSFGKSSTFGTGLLSAKSKCVMALCDSIAETAPSFYNVSCFKFTVYRIEPFESQLVDYSYAAVIYFIMSCRALELHLLRAVRNPFISDRKQNQQIQELHRVIPDPLPPQINSWGITIAREIEIVSPVTPTKLWKKFFFYNQSLILHKLLILEVILDQWASWHFLFFAY